MAFCLNRWINHSSPPRASSWLRSSTSSAQPLDPARAPGALVTPALPARRAGVRRETRSASAGSGGIPQCAPRWGLGGSRQGWAQQVPFLGRFVGSLWPPCSVPVAAASQRGPRLSSLLDAAVGSSVGCAGAWPRCRASAGG